MPRVATKLDLLYLNYLYIKESNKIEGMDIPSIFNFKIATYLSQIEGSTIFILSPYSTVFMENTGSSKVVVHIILGEEDRGKRGVELVKQGLKWYKENYPSTTLIQANIPKSNKKCSIFAMLIGMKKKGETEMLSIPMNVYEMEV